MPYLTVQLDFRVFMEDFASQALARLRDAGLDADDPSRYAEHIPQDGSDPSRTRRPSDVWMGIRCASHHDLDPSRHRCQGSRGRRGRADAAVDAAVARLDTTISPHRTRPDRTVADQAGRLGRPDREIAQASIPEHWRRRVGATSACACAPVAAPRGQQRRGSRDPMPILPTHLQSDRQRRFRRNQKCDAHAEHVVWSRASWLGDVD